MQSTLVLRNVNVTGEGPALGCSTGDPKGSPGSGVLMACCRSRNACTGEDPGAVGVSGGVCG